MDIITLSHKATTSEAFEGIHQVVLDFISENISSLVQSGNYGAINTTYTSIMGCYLIKFVSEEHILQYDTTCDGQISSAGEIVIDSQYLICMKENTNWYW